MAGLEKYVEALKALPKNISEAEINAEMNKSCLIKLSCNKIIENIYSDITELFVRVSGDKTGFAYTQDLEEDAETVLQRAYKNSLEIEERKRNILNNSDCNSIVSGNTDFNTDINIQEMKSVAELLEKRILESHVSVINVISEVRVDICSSRVINSLGLDISSNRKVYYVNAHVTAEHNNLQYNTACSSSAGSFGDINYDILKGKIINSLEGQFDAAGLISGEYPALLDSSVGVNIMMTAWQLFSGIKYNEGSTALYGKLNSKIGSGNFTVYDVPSHEGTGYRFAADCEGTPCKPLALVKKGCLTGLLHNISSAAVMKAAATGHAGRYALLSGTIPTDIIVTPKILYIEKGDKKIDSLLDEMQDGIYITESYDVFHSINIASGDFSIPCRGTIIKGGKKLQNVTEMTISGNLLDLFNNIAGAGDDLYIEEFLKKSYCIGSPSLLVKKIQINAG